MAKQPDVIHIESLVAFRNRQPYVVLTWGEKRAQLTVDEARAHALRVLEVAEGAEGDSFLVNWLEQKVGAEPAASAEMLKDLRRYREERAAHGGKADN